MADFVTVADDFVIIKITQLSDFVKKGQNFKALRTPVFWMRAPYFYILLMKMNSWTFRKK